MRVVVAGEPRLVAAVELDLMRSSHMRLESVTLEGSHVRLEPLTAEHAPALVSAAADGELWNLTVTVVPSAATIESYLAAAFRARDAGIELPFAIRARATDRILGTTRFRNIELAHRRVEIGSTWLAATAQRTAINTEAKLLLLTHAFEKLNCLRVELVTDFLNTRSRAAIARLGAKQEGILRAHMIMPGGRVRDSVYFSLLAAEWPAAKANLQAKLAGRRAGTAAETSPPPARHHQPSSPGSFNAAPFRLAGTGVRLEPLTPGHLDALSAIGLAPELWQATTIRVLKRNDMEAYIRHALAQQTEGSVIPFVIVEQSAGQVVGSTRFHSLAPEHRRLEIGFTFIAPRWQRTHVNTETKLLMLSHAFETWHCNRVQFTANAINDKSRAALRRIGAREEAVFRHHRLSPHLGPCDVAVYSIIASEWPTVRANLEQRLSARSLG